MTDIGLTSFDHLDTPITVPSMSLFRRGPTTAVLATILAEREKADDAWKTGVSDRVDHLNQLRTDVITDRSQFVRTGQFDAELKAVNLRLSAVESWKSKATGAAVVLTLFAGAVGAAVMRVLTGS
jgi:hypothetical protein